ncbi:proton-translocating NADH-quinone oxidoreductase, chain L family protein [Rickettsia felis str. Pedreira]|uniref:NADH-quinone oxidoreductase subunit L n=3 Tax=Rickettsia felis TaxID=42862 RepID=NUOL_RICFE|nr:NADH-quinone oxidoreductase subunit L [Rickettsia felis]Q4UK27.1 RecName: Full=NADH-quinone oxidoreductase subunit L; AltName: Full=NADH dehydrogenase I subunit L; AltName: Full=NDH-1 subunit L [Rickettsia felis URRWXCal2]AAY62108.1 NADH dehydrogenase I chain L [Rickettsia felis URRWXCal2]KHO02632.1 NADH:ubiquinone oxidoreductase subunit L [Rickettsia felis]KJV58728.1 proton-translocating NADH-quinone oxidoreductase, chain L family protein [Rickettsia felis str. Pedreira]MDE8610684.1 NADH-q
MYQNLAIMIIMLPLASSVINGLFLKVIDTKLAQIIATGFLSLSALFSLVIFCDAGLDGNIIHIKLLPWIEVGNFKVNWSIYIDQLTSIMFIAVTWVSSVVHIYSLGYMAEDKGIIRFLSFLSLFTFFMLMLVSADNFLQLFFGWEGVGVCSYLLIGFWYSKESANKAAIKAFITNRASDFAFILGIITIIVYCGSANYKDVFSSAELLSNTKIFLQFSILDVICLLLFIGCMGKSAQIGLHVWLPDAMEGPTPVSALIHAATMVTAGVFLVARCSYLFEYSPLVLQFITIIGGVTCLFAASIAIMQSDIKKIIAYSTCSQLGYMFMACGVSAYNSGIFHLVTHAFFKALLFLSAGSIIHAVHEQDIFKMGDLRNKMPVTYGNSLIGSLALIGIYPLAGFYSKDSILEAAYSSGSFMFIFGIAAAILTAIYSMKIIMLVFYGKTKLEKDVFEHAHEPAKIMNTPLILLVAGSFFSGMIGYYLLSMDKPNGYFHESLFNLHIYKLLISHPPLYIKLLPMAVGIMGIVIGICVYNSSTIMSFRPSSMSFPRKRESSKPFNLVYNILHNKYYFDEIYNFLIVKPINCLASLFYLGDQKIIDRFGPNGFSRVVNCFSVLTGKTQTGYVFNYALYIVSFIVVVISVFVWKG